MAKNHKQNGIDYGDIDQNVRKLVQVLNIFHAVRTIGSCGGHENPTRGQWSAGNWYIKFEITKDDFGWLMLEFLAWAINSDYRREHNVYLLPDARPPYLNFPGKMLTFVIEGYDEDPDELAEFLEKVYPELFFTPEAWEAGEELPEG